MVKDRLDELRKLGNISDDPSVQLTIDHKADDGELLTLLEKLSYIYEEIKKINKHVDELHCMVHEHDNRDKIEDKIALVKSDTRRIRKTIDDLRNYTNCDSPVLCHIAQTHHLALSIYFSEAVASLSTIHAETHDKHRQYVRKELLITGQKFTEDELDDLLEQQSPFTQDHLQKTELAKQQLQDLQNRHNEIIKLEKSITELAKLFQEMHTLVTEQGESINRIENFVYEAQVRTEKGREELHSAQENQTKARKKKLIIYIIIAVILIIIILSIVFSLA